MDKNTTQHIAVAVVIQRNDRLLMVEEGKEGIRGQWNLPTGHVEHCENIVAAAKREAKEETGLDITPTSILGIENYTATNQAQYIKVIFLADTPQDTTLRANGTEIISAQWMAPNEIQALGNKLRKPHTIALVLERLANGTTYSLELLKDYL